jgi:hypothetical protein
MPHCLRYDSLTRGGFALRLNNRSDTGGGSTSGGATPNGANRATASIERFA